MQSATASSSKHHMLPIPSAGMHISLPLNVPVWTFQQGTKHSWLLATETQSQIQNMRSLHPQHLHSFLLLIRGCNRSHLHHSSM